MLFKAVTLSLLTLASAHAMAADCQTTVDSTDMMTYDTKAIEISRTCKTFTVNLTHSGGLPVAVMGHNWVLAKAADADGIAADGMVATLDHDYLKVGDARVLAHTKVIGAGEKDSVTFDVTKLDPAQQYVFFCSYPGHISMMKGTVSLVD